MLRETSAGSLSVVPGPALDSEHKVLWLDVAMDDALAVARGSNTPQVTRSLDCLEAKPWSASTQCAAALGPQRGLLSSVCSRLSRLSRL